MTFLGIAQWPIHRGAARARPFKYGEDGKYNLKAEIESFPKVPGTNPPPRFGKTKDFGILWMSYCIAKSLWAAGH